MAAAEIPVMIMVSGNFFCSLRGHHRRLYTNILSSSVELLFCLLVCLGLVLCLFGLCVCMYYF